MSNPSPPDPDRPGDGRPTRSGQGPGSGASGATPSPPPSSGSPAQGGTDGGAARPPAGPEPKPPTPFTQQLGRITIIVLAALFAVFALANSQPVDFSWVFGETTTREAADGTVSGGVPLILLLLGAFVAGALITFLTELYVGRARRARRAAKERAAKGRGTAQEPPKGRKGRKDPGTSA